MSKKVTCDNEERKNLSNIITDSSFEEYNVFEEIRTRGKSLYENTPFEQLQKLSSRTKGAYFEKIVEEFLQKQGYIVNLPSRTSDYDRIVNGKRVEIKGSFLWGDGTNGFRWQQIRPHQQYDYIFFLAVYPSCMKLFFSAKCDVIDFVLQKDANGHYIHNQHGGKTVNSGTFFLQGFPEDFHFFRQFGNSFSSGGKP